MEVERKQQTPSPSLKSHVHETHSNNNGNALSATSSHFSNVTPGSSSSLSSPGISSPFSVWFDDESYFPRSSAVRELITVRAQNIGITPPDSPFTVPNMARMLSQESAEVKQHGTSETEESPLLLTFGEFATALVELMSSASPQGLELSTPPGTSLRRTPLESPRRARQVGFDSTAAGGDNSGEFTPTNSRQRRAKVATSASPIHAVVGSLTNILIGARGRTCRTSYLESLAAQHVRSATVQAQSNQPSPTSRNSQVSAAASSSSTTIDVASPNSQDVDREVLTATSTRTFESPRNQQSHTNQTTEGAVSQLDSNTRATDSPPGQEFPLLFSTTIFDHDASQQRLLQEEEEEEDGIGGGAQQTHEQVVMIRSSFSSDGNSMTSVHLAENERRDFKACSLPLGMESGEVVDSNGSKHPQDPDNDNSITEAVTKEALDVVEIADGPASKSTNWPSSEPARPLSRSALIEDVVSNGALEAIFRRASASTGLPRGSAYQHVRTQYRTDEENSLYVECREKKVVERDSSASSSSVVDSAMSVNPGKGVGSWGRGKAARLGAVYALRTAPFEEARHTPPQMWIRCVSAPPSAYPQSDGQE